MNEMQVTMNPENELLTPALIAQITQIVGQGTYQIVKPLIELVQQNAAEQREAQQLTNERIDALEKQMRYNTPVTPVQVKYIKAEIKERSAAILEEKSISKRGARDMSAAIKKELLKEFGVSCVNEIPKCDYRLAMDWIGAWMNPKVVRAIRSKWEEEEKL